MGREHAHLNKIYRPKATKSTRYIIEGYVFKTRVLQGLF